MLFFMQGTNTAVARRVSPQRTTGSAGAATRLAASANFSEHDMDSTTLARVEDARWFADVLETASVTADDVLDLTAREWRIATIAAGARRGRPMGFPSDAVQSLVWHRLAERERLQDTNPLDGIGMRC